MMSHLRHLEKEEFPAKEEILQGKTDRPNILYRPSAELLVANKTKSD